MNLLQKILEGFFLNREKPNENYLTGLKFQWRTMNKIQRRRFVLGALLGLIIILILTFVFFLIAPLSFVGTYLNY